MRTPSLRNLEGTAPYMHKGQMQTLAEVLRHYNEAPLAMIGHNESKPLGLRKRELRQLEAFLDTLAAPLATDPAWLRPPQTGGVGVHPLRQRDLLFRGERLDGSDLPKVGTQHLEGVALDDPRALLLRVLALDAHKSALLLQHHRLRTNRWPPSGALDRNGSTMIRGGENNSNKNIEKVAL